MGTVSAVNKYPAPAVGDLADGPSAVGDVANRLERQMPTFRGINNYEIEGWRSMGYAPNWTNLHTASTPLSVIGWADIDCEMAMWAMNPASYCGGWWQVLANGVQVALGRWHNYAAGPMFRCWLQASIPVPVTLNLLSTQVQVYAEAGNTGAQVPFTRIIVRQYGVPATG